MEKDVEIVFQPSGRRGRVPAGTTILAAAQGMGVGIEAVCGGKGVCGKCRVIIEEGRFEKLGLVSSKAHVSGLSSVRRNWPGVTVWLVWRRSGRAWW